MHSRYRVAWIDILLIWFFCNRGRFVFFCPLSVFFPKYLWDLKPRRSSADCRHHCRHTCLLLQSVSGVFPQAHIGDKCRPRATSRLHWIPIGLTLLFRLRSHRNWSILIGKEWIWYDFCSIIISYMWNKGKSGSTLHQNASYVQGVREEPLHQRKHRRQSFSSWSFLERRGFLYFKPIS